MKVISVTANPAIDLTIHASDWKRGIVNRGQKIDKTAGGKGLTVAINLRDAGIDASVTGWMGARNDSTFVTTFAEHHLDDHFIRIPGDTRRCIKIIDNSTGETTDINMPGLAIPEQARTQLVDYLDANLSRDAVLVMGGSLPQAIEEDFYARMVARFRARCRCVVVDTSDGPLKATMQAEVLPHVIKPNIHELSEFCGHSVEDDADVVAIAREFIDRGVALAVVSMGSRGAWFVNRATALHAAPPRVKVMSTVGAGDAMVAGIVRGIILGHDLDQMARTATAYSAYNIQHMGTCLRDRARIVTLKSQVVISQLPEGPAVLPSGSDARGADSSCSGSSS